MIAAARALPSPSLPTTITAAHTPRFAPAVSCARAPAMEGRVCTVLLLMLALAAAAVADDAPPVDPHVLQQALRIVMEKNSEFAALREEVLNLK